MIPTNRLKTPEEIFDQKQRICGIDKLKERISHISRPAQLIWMKNPYDGTAVKGTEDVVFPPEEIMNEVKRFAASKHVDVIW